MKTRTRTLLVVPALLPFLVAGCVHDDDDTDPVSYQVEVLNLTAAQPLSPAAVVFHRSGYSGWEVGATAGDGLEYLAEGGTTAEFVEEAESQAAVVTTAEGEAAIAPGATGELVVDLRGRTGLELTVAGMLVNTNDAFTGVTGLGIGDLAVRETTTVDLVAWDAGTEANTETAATVPGPAAGGEGFNTARDDTDRVSGHPGVVTRDDGLANSALGEAHRFDHPVARLTVTRLQ